jgi:imidazolonepropionase-like amidohydrolase
MYIAPGSSAIVGGQGAVVKTAGPDFESLVLREPAAIDMTLGEPPKQAFGESGRSPATRMAVAALLRQALVDAQAYARSLEEYESKSEEEKEKASPPPRDLAKEALVKLLQGEIPARVQADREDDIRTALRISEEFGFQLVLDGATQAHKMREELARRKVAAVIGPITGLPYASVDRRGGDDRNAARLHEAGVKIAIASHSRGLGSLATASTGRWLLLDAAFAQVFGLPEDAVLKALTLEAAEILGVSDRLGSLSPGKDADFIILNGPPLRIKTWVDKAYVNGERVYVRE